MDNSFDLDISNYTIDDLLQFFKLETPYNIMEINNKYDFLKDNIVKKVTDIQFKKRILIFMYILFCNISNILYIFSIIS